MVANHKKPEYRVYRQMLDRCGIKYGHKWKHVEAA